MLPLASRQSDNLDAERSLRSSYAAAPQIHETLAPEICYCLSGITPAFACAGAGVGDWVGASFTVRLFPSKIHMQLQSKSVVTG